MKRYLWVVEREQLGEWVMTHDAFTTRKEAREKIIYRRNNGPLWLRESKFRVTKYTPEEPT